MAIFGSTKTNEVIDDIVIEESTITPTMECSDQILLEFAEDLHKVQSGLYVADILIEEKICTEGYSEDIEAIAEGTVKDAISKTVKIFKDFWEKVKAWFKTVIENFKVRITTQKNFLSKYESAVKEKAKNQVLIKNFSHKEYQYDLNKIKNACSAAQDVIKKEVEHVKGLDVKEILRKPTPDNPAQKYVNDKISYNNIDYMEYVCGAINTGSKNGADVKKYINTVGKSAAEITMNVGELKIDDMISFLKGKDLDEVNAAQSVMDSNMKKIISTFEAAQTAASKEDGRLETFNRVAANSKNLLTLSQNITSTEVKLFNDMSKAYVKAMKHILVFKTPAPAKENSTSLLESAMSLIG